MKFNFFKKKNATISDRFAMVTQEGNGFYSYNGKLYYSDIVRTCIKPRTKELGKATAKHIREKIVTDENGKKKTQYDVNPDAYMRFLLEEPNPLMTGQMMQEKVANQLSLNSNAFILIVRDPNGIPVELYPIPCVSVRSEFENGQLFLRFFYKNGKNGRFPYTEIIHLRDDFLNDDVFGDSPGKALTELMECVTTIDQGIVKAVKNSSLITWLLKFKQSMRPEDLKSNIKDFVTNYLSIDSETFGAAGVDAKADVERVEYKDYVPNASISRDLIERIYNFFQINKKIASGNYTEDEFISFYNISVSPVLQQMSGEYTRKLFSRRERSAGNRIDFDSANFEFASMNTKLALTGFLDRGTLLPNEVRKILRLSPIDGGDEPLLRKDTGKLVEKGGEEDGTNTD